MWVWKTEKYKKKFHYKNVYLPQKKPYNFKALKEAFKIFDKNRNGYIEAKELKAVTTTLGQALSDDEFSEFWNEADANSDGKLDYEEFIKMMLQYWCFWFKNCNNQKKIIKINFTSKWCYSIDLIKTIPRRYYLLSKLFECNLKYFSWFLFIKKSAKDLFLSC